MINYTVYTAKGCKHSMKVVQMMAHAGLDFDVISVRHNPEAIKTLEEFNTGYSVPQVFANEKLIGGYEDFLRYARKEKLFKRGE